MSCNILAATFLVVLGCGGCSSGAERSEKVVATKHSVKKSFDPNAEPPIEAAFGGAQSYNARRYRWAQENEELIKQCMGKAGYSYTPDLESERAMLYDYYMVRWQTVIGDAEYRARWGYGLSTAYRPDGTQYSKDGLIPTEGVEHGQSRVGGDPSSAAVGYAEALLGSKSAGTKGDVKGCTDEAWGQMDRKYPAFSELSGLNQEIDKEASSSPEMGQAVKAFLACMGDNGYQTEDPVNTGSQLLLEDFGKLFDGGEPGPNFADRLPQFQQRELALAKLEWSCREKTLNPVIAKIRWQVETALLERSSDLVAQVKRQGP